MVDYLVDEKVALKAYLKVDYLGVWMADYLGEN